MKNPISQRIYSENDSVVVDKKKAPGILRKRARQKQKQIRTKYPRLIGKGIQ